MKTKMPFDGFYLKLLDEQNGTHEYEEYLRNCKENPLTEEEQREWTEGARAAIAELEQLNAEPEPTRQAAEAEADKVPEVEVVPAEAIVPLGQTGEDAPAEKERWAYASELIGDAFQHWGNGRVLLDMGTGRGKNEFIIKKLVSWRVDEMLKNTTIGRVLCLCPLNTLHAEMLQRRTEAAIAEADDEPTEIAMTYDVLYESMLEVQTYQYIESRYRNDPASLKKYLAGFKYIVADECHYFTDFSSYGMNTYLSLEVLQKAEADQVVIYMSATGEETYKLLEETSKTPEDRIYKLPQDYQHIKQKYFYSRENLVMMLKSLPEDEKAVIFVSSGEDLLKMREMFGDTAAYYCSENNPKYGKMFNKLTDCIKNRELQKRYLFTTKAFGIGTEIKDRTVKHLYIDQWKPTDIIQSTGRKRPLDVDDTCTVYFRDYDADWYYGDLKKFKAIVTEELKPAVAYLAGAEAFEVFRNSGTPDSINNKIRKCRIMEFDDAKGEYRVNPLGVRQLKRELELLNEMQQKPILVPSEPYEKGSVMNPCVLWDKDEKIFKMWYAAGEQFEPDVLCYAESKDGINWERYANNPILEKSNEKYDQCKVGGCDILKENDRYYMFYIGYQNVDTARVCMAESNDGIHNWVRSMDNPVISPEKKSWDADAVYKPTVVLNKQKNKLLMWYNGRKQNCERIGLAEYRIK